MLGLDVTHFIFSQGLLTSNTDGSRALQGNPPLATFTVDLSELAATPEGFGVPLETGKVR